MGRGKLLDVGSEMSWLDSPRKRSPLRQSRISTASTCAGSSTCSPGRQSRLSRQSCSSWMSSTSMEEPPLPVAGEALLTSLPLPMGIRSWEWPLSRHEKKALVLMFDRQELMLQRDELECQLRREAC